MRIFIAILALLMLTACGEQASQTNNQPDDQSQTTTAETPKASADAEKEVAALFEKQANANWKVTYHFSGSMGGEQMSGTMSQYMKGEKKFRMDFGSKEGEMRSYLVNNVYTTCYNQGEWSCMKIEGNDSDNFAMESREIQKDFEEDPTQWDIAADGTKQVAGVTAQCYKMNEHGATEFVRYCFAKEGVPLYVRMESKEGVTEMEATSYSTSVSDSDFVPPAEAKDLSTMYGGAGGTSPAGGDACSYCNYLSGTDKDECLASC